MSFYKEVPGRQTTLESTLKFDLAPTAGSTNPVTSDGVKSAIDGAVGDAAAALQEQIDDIAEKAGSGYTPKGPASVATLNALSGQENGWLYTMTNAGTLTDGSLAVTAGDTVAWDETNSVWYKAMDYAPNSEFKLVKENVEELDDDVDALKNYTNIEEYVYTYDEISSSDSAVGYALNANSQYHMAQYDAYGSAFDTFVFPVVAGKTYKATNVYGNNIQPTNIVVSKNAISVGGSAKGYTDGWNTGTSSLAKVDKEFTAAVNGYAYITGKTGDNDVKLYEVIATPKNIKQKFDEIEYGRTNQWAGKKVVWMGTSVPFGSNATTSYAKIASDVLGFEIVPACVPGLAIECLYDNDSGLLYPKQYGSSALTKAEYTAAKAAGLTNITINDNPVTPWSPGGGYNNYYCTWENVINNDNADADLWVLDVVPNNGGWSTSDWDAFDFANWEYSDQSSFADHRRTFLGALLYLINEIYTLNPNARICLMLGSNFSYDQGKTAFAKLREKGVALIDIWKKANWLKPSLDVIKSQGGTDWHPSNFGHECLGKMLVNELLLIA